MKRLLFVVMLVLLASIAFANDPNIPDPGPGMDLQTCWLWGMIPYPCANGGHLEVPRGQL